ncbi:unknown [Clostridium sp. CAG:452]|nr:unknown [Clostridium sp. CAG:452]
MQDINKFINSYEMTRKLMKKMQSNKGGMRNMMKNLDANSLKGMKF